ncbi:unnamed protein product, partial [Staurois parvus]
MVWCIHPALYQRFRLVVSWCGVSILPCINGSGWWLVVSWCGVSILPCINGSGWWCHGVVYPSCLVSTVQAGGVMVWCIHPALYQRFRLVVSWCGVSILPCINGSGWWCHGVVYPSCLVSTVQA